MRPTMIAHGETALLDINFDKLDYWRSFTRDFIEDGSAKLLKTLRAEIYTSVGPPMKIIPDPKFLEFLRPFFED